MFYELSEFFAWSQVQRQLIISLIDVHQFACFKFVAQIFEKTVNAMFVIAHIYLIIFILSK